MKNFLTPSWLKTSTIASLLLGSNWLGASPIESPPICEKANNNQLQDLRFRTQAGLSESTAFSLGADIGVHKARVGAGFGYALSPQDALKFSAEYLSQNLRYNFAGFNSERHQRQQTALGASYKRAVTWDWISFLDVSVGYSYAPSKGLSPEDVGYYRAWRSLAGTRMVTSTLGATAKLSEKAFLRITAGWEHFNIARTHESPCNLTGAHVGFSLNQKLHADVTTELKAECHRIYNLYSASINYLGLKKGWEAGVYVERTHTKYNLPNTTAFGIQINLDLDTDQPQNSLVEWMKTPAFSQPAVLVSTDDIFHLTPG